MIQLLVDNKAAIVAGVISSLIAAGIVAGIGPLRRLPNVPVPTWLFAAIVAFAAFSWWWAHKEGNTQQPVLDKSFASQFVDLDGKHFIRCKFDRCTLVFRGKRPFSFEHCEFTAPMFRISDSAALTIQEFVALRGDPAFRPLVDDLLQRGQ